MKRFIASILGIDEQNKNLNPQPHSSREIDNMVDARVNAKQHEQARKAATEDERKQEILREAEAYISGFIERQRAVSYKDAVLKQVYEDNHSTPTKAAWLLSGDDDFRTWWLLSDGRLANLHAGSQIELQPLWKKEDGEAVNVSSYSIEELTKLRESLKPPRAQEA